MNLRFLTVPLFILGLLSSCSGKDCITKQTTNPKHLKRPLKTNKCFGCNLGDADLRGANLKGANLSKANLVKANLDGADLRGANLSQAQLSWYDEDTGWGFRGQFKVTSTNRI